MLMWGGGGGGGDNSHSNQLLWCLMSIQKETLGQKQYPVSII